ncbi:MAG TPA: penicillin-binding protein 2 [Acidimicrobiia bacterium]|nr:penicillin-binding protein 2 [Acidimicrobiia bacterium]
MSDNSRVRVSIVGVVIVALFTALFARLWFLQMGPEQNLRAEAFVRATRIVQTESPRGSILDRNGVVLVQDRPAWAIAVDRNLDRTTRTRILGQLSELLGVPVKTLRAAYTSLRQPQLKPAIIAYDVPLDKRLAILEHQDHFPGVHVEHLTVRTYPAAQNFHDPTFASQLLGYVGEIDATQLTKLKKKGYEPGDSIGRSGVEAAYESQLRGDPQRDTVEIDPTGRQVGAPIAVHPGSVGHDVVLTIDARVQLAAERALAEGIAAARTQPDVDYKKFGNRNLRAPGGAVVVLDVHDGSVVAMASNPSYPLDWWQGGMTQGRYALLSRPDAHNPFLNRATDGLYAPGSTFKLVTALALNQFGVLPASQYLDDHGSISFGGSTFANDNGEINGPVNLSRALTVSSDVYFYTAGLNFWQIFNGGPFGPADHARGLGIQSVARSLGFGQPTGIEIGDSAGRIPDPAWKSAYAHANYTGDAIQQNSIWYPADNIFTAVGQGDDFVSPLQLADAYAAFANGGTVWTPHVGLEVRDAMTHKVVSRHHPKMRSKDTIDGFVHDQMLSGFEGVTTDPKGTAHAAFAGLSMLVAGKTGTAQVGRDNTPAKKGPTSLFASFFPADHPQYAVVAVVEEAGHGAAIAAPIVRQVIESMMGISPVTPIAASAGND